MRRHYFPLLRREVELIKRHKDVTVFFHSDGNLNAVFAEIVDCGFDGVHSLQPSVGMDIGRIKCKYGGRICLMGNMDLNELLPFGSPEEVEDATRRTIKIAAPGGGFILSTCNTLMRTIPPENALAMYRAAEEHGYYPIGGTRR